VLAGLTFALAAVIITRSLRRATWAASARALAWVGHLPWMAFVLTYATLLIMMPRNGGKLGPDVWIGWPTRLLVLSIAVWTIVVAGHVRSRLPQAVAPLGQAG
jgi:hypothetical protein